MQLDESRAGVVGKATDGVAVLADDLERNHSSVHDTLLRGEDHMEITASALRAPDLSRHSRVIERAARAGTAGMRPPLAG